MPTPLLTQSLAFDPTDPRRTYDLSKALGENIVLTRTGGRGVRMRVLPRGALQGRAAVVADAEHLGPGGGGDQDATHKQQY